MPMPLITLLLFAAAAAVVVISWFHERRNQSRERLFAMMEDGDEAQSGGLRGALSLWLLRAGYRHTAAAQRFLGLTLGAVFAGFLVALLLQLTGMSEQIANRLAVIPGSLAQVLAAVATTLPWILLVLCGVAPMLIVRKQRRIRERRMHVELPVLLDLMATLTAAGLGFDTALERYLQAADPSSPLVQEWRQFQREIAAGQARVAALRAVATRCHVIPVSTAVSALVQAEVQGSSIANILAQQAEDARLRRRDQVLLLAQALPVKLVFPLMICFLPGIFIVTLGPALLEFVRMADQIIRNTAR